MNDYLDGVRRERRRERWLGAAIIIGLLAIVVWSGGTFPY